MELHRSGYEHHRLGLHEAVLGGESGDVMRHLQFKTLVPATICCSGCVEEDSLTWDFPMELLNWCLARQLQLVAAMTRCHFGA